MNIIEIIGKKRDKQALSEEEINYFIEEYVDGKIKDYQASALLMAVQLNGMNITETIALTNAMLHSGDIIDLSGISGIKSDKHSTGGVGDKVSLVLCPLLASCGAKIAKMSGRGLGHTGGTIDKLEAIPHYKVDISIKQFIKQVNDINIAIVGQTGNLVPADKKLYALRDVTGTVGSIPLIASSIMSKKLASGTDTILLDVKVGQGAFMKNIEEARALSKLMIEIGENLHRDVKAVITDMDQPLGYAIGNTLEVKEVIETLQGNGPEDLTTLCLELGAIMLVQAQIYQDKKAARAALEENLHNGKGFEKLVELVKAQKGDTSVILDPSNFAVAKKIKAIKSPQSGYLNKMNALKIGQVALELGAGRHQKEDDIDFAAGIVLAKKVNDYIEKGEVIAHLHSDKAISKELQNNFIDALVLSKKADGNDKLIFDIIE